MYVEYNIWEYCIAVVQALTRLSKQTQYSLPTTVCGMPMPSPLAPVNKTDMEPL